LKGGLEKKQRSWYPAAGSLLCHQLEAAAGKRSIDGLEAVGEIDVNQEHLVGVAMLKVYVQ